MVTELAVRGGRLRPAEALTEALRRACEGSIERAIQLWPTVGQNVLKAILDPSVSGAEQQVPDPNVIGGEQIAEMYGHYHIAIPPSGWK